tara:strand:- start:200 stop:493 length:294 start_codon:yes stop_codon:yes gene_type:complete
MFARVCQIASLLSLFITLSMLGGSYYAFRFVTSEQFKARVMNEILDNVSGILPKVLDQELPKVTGPMVEMSNDSKQFWEYIETRKKEQIEEQMSKFN